MNLKHRNRSLAIALLGICGGVCGGLQAATITITSISDALNPGGGCTLRGAVAAVNAGADAHGCTATGSYGDNDTVIFSNTLAGQTVQYTAANGGIVIEKALTIQGPTAAENDPRRRVTLRGIKEEKIDFSLLTAEWGAPLTVRDLNFIDNAFMGEGSGINAGSTTLTAVRCAFSNLTGGSHGVAVYTGENVDLDFCTFSDNKKGYEGGAVYAQRGGTVKNSTFNRNSADWGGALASDNTFYIVNSTFSNNTAESNGGAISANAVVNGSSFIGNRAGDGYGGSGGAIYSWGQSSISNSVFNGNTARDSGGAIQGSVIDIDSSIFSNNSSGIGGAIRIEGNSHFPANTRISSTVFSGNSATIGGAVYFVRDLTAHHLTFTDNAASSGPAVYSDNSYYDSKANIVNSTFVGRNNNPLCAGGTYTGDYNYGWRSVGNGVSDQSCSRP